MDSFSLEKMLIYHNKDFNFDETQRNENAFFAHAHEIKLRVDQKRVIERENKNVIPIKRETESYFP